MIFIFLQIPSCVGDGNVPPVCSTFVSITPGSLSSACSSCQKQPVLSKIAHFCMHLSRTLFGMFSPYNDDHDVGCDPSFQNSLLDTPDDGFF